MNRPLRVDLFVEDRAHEEFLKALVNRLAREKGKAIHLQVRSSRGGHGRALAELEIYQRALVTGASGLALPDLLVVAIDANCRRFQRAKKEIGAKICTELRSRVVIACPDPHVERWYLADSGSVERAVGAKVTIEKESKCQRDHYKRKLSTAVRQAGYPPTLGGIEFAREIVEAMDLYGAGKFEKSLGALVEELSAKLSSS